MNLIETENRTEELIQQLTAWIHGSGKPETGNAVYRAAGGWLLYPHGISACSADGNR
ncbi:hypothetical protein [Emergencia sp. JLR.KK010]|uniref:hypothetical protein n=1 Tax=Emergencia sp. JLR.KK010 TaxID=3114296 RepID=UPI0030CECB9E